MRIVLVHRREWPSSGPSASFSTFNAHALARCGAEVTLIVGRGSDQTPDWILSHYYGLFPHGRLRILPIRKPGSQYIHSSLPFYMMALRRVFALARRKRIDAVLSRDPGFLPYLCIIKKMAGIPVFYETHNFFMDVSSQPDLRQNLRFREKYHRIERCCIPSMDGLLCLLTPQAELYRRYFPSHRICVAHPGVNPLKPPKGSLYERKCIGYVGGLQARRDIEMLFQAFKLIGDHALRLLIIGGRKKEMPRVQQWLEKYDLNDRVTVTGWVSYVELERLLDKISVGVVPMKDTFYNRYLTAPIKIFDYLSRGIPVVAADLPSAREFIEDGKEGVFYKPEVPGDLASAIFRLLQSEDQLQDLSRGAMEKARVLSWERRAEQILDFVARRDERSS